MKLKVDDKGNVVLDNGLPVWVADDGKEIAYNVPELVNKLSAVNSESAGRRKEIDELTAKLKVFDGIDPEKYKALEAKAADLESGKLIESGKLEEVRQQISQGYAAKIADLEKARAADVEKSTQALQAKDAAIRSLLVKSAFDASGYLREKTVLPPDLAYQSFGKHFEVKEENGELKVVATIEGQPIFSRANPGTPATPEEAIEAIIESYPMRDRIMKTTQGGANTPPSGVPGGGGAPKSLADCKTEDEKVAYLKSKAGAV
jgi:hypothetical protein